MEKSINAFPGYEFKRLEDGSYHNMYRGVDLGKGGWVYSEPGIYSNVALLDIQSMHPTSIIELNKLGKYTKRYAELKQARVLIKHKDYEKASELFGGRLKKYLAAKESAKALSKALKLPLNAFFGISFAAFDNPARDSRDKNNIIALRGALFMKTLFDKVEQRGFHIIHVKTDSCKIPNATLEIVQFVQEFAKKYGYEMEHEATYERMCLIDKAQYIASYATEEQCMKLYGYCPDENKEYIESNGHTWTATGSEFQRPYIFKTLFSGETPSFDDKCETKSVKNAEIYLDLNEELPDVSVYENELMRRVFNVNHPEKPMKLNPEFDGMTKEDLVEVVMTGHDYHFIGRVGRFYPIRPGRGGGLLVAHRNDKFDFVSGAKDYRWLEAERVKTLGYENNIDPRYHEEQVNEAIAAIATFGSFERFVDLSKPYISEEAVEDRPKSPVDDCPFDLVPCGDNKYNTCMDCPNCVGDICKRGYSLASYIEKGGDA